MGVIKSFSNNPSGKHYVVSAVAEYPGSDYIYLTLDPMITQTGIIDVAVHRDIIDGRTLELGTTLFSHINFRAEIVVPNCPLKKVLRIESFEIFNSRPFVQMKPPAKNKLTPSSHPRTL